MNSSYPSVRSIDGSRCLSGAIVSHEHASSVRKVSRRLHASEFARSDCRLAFRRVVAVIVCSLSQSDAGRRASLNFLRGSRREANRSRVQPRAPPLASLDVLGEDNLSISMIGQHTVQTF